MSQGLFLIEFEEAEIRATARRLQTKGYVEYIDPTEKWGQPQIRINDEIYQKINSNIQAVRSLETEIFDEWEQDLIEKYHLHPIVKEKVDLIIENLHTFLSSIIFRHGIECVNLLYPEKPKAQQWLNDVKGPIITDLPKIDEFLDAVITIEIPNFFVKQDEKRIRYLYQLFNSSFLWHLVQVDDKCSSLFKEVIQGQKLYLDNNVLYHLVGINGAVVLKSAHKTLELARGLGYELWVTTKTLSEFHESLNWRMREFKKKMPIPAELARIAVNNLGEQSFVTSYWSEYAKSGISIEEFVSEKSHIDEIINGLKIQVTGDLREEIEKSEELKQEESVLSGIVEYTINPNIIEHDAFHRIFINKIRNGDKYHFREAIAWFLTNDSKLPVYDRVARKGKNNLPFCITTDQWIQVNRPLLARTSNRQEFEDSFHVLVTQPFIRAMTSTLDLDKAYQDVLGKLAKYDRMNPQLAIQIVADSHFMYSVSKDDKYDVPYEKLENKFIDIAEQLRKSNDAVRSEIKEKEQYINEREIQNQSIVDNLSKDLDETRTDLSTAFEQIKGLEKKEKKLKSLLSWGLFAVVAIPLSIFLWSDNFINSSAFVSTPKQLPFVKLFLQLIIVSILLIIPLRRHWKYLLGTMTFSLVLELISLFTGK